MSKFTNLIIVSVGTGVGGWLPTLFGAGVFSGWSILGSLIGGMTAVYLIWQNR